MSATPTVLKITQIATETIPIVIDFVRDVTGVVFTLTHGAWAVSTVVGAGTQISIPISEARAAATATTYNYRIVANEGVEGSEEIACLGPWEIVPA